ncbi:hypothetical protein R1sor_005090 [Riccia sorocarpa]|uniref:IRS-type PTB domain-containing protein n=1 Tax=Riccia sorocarpa TaxID=122646 RepID=A0ABD3HM42_9MARC
MDVVHLEQGVPYVPYSDSTFFNVRRIQDPSGLFPNDITLGINKRGVHFFRRVPKEYLHSAELHDIMEYGSNSTTVLLTVRVTSVLQSFLFESNEAGAICATLQSQINIAVMRLYTKALSTGGDSVRCRPEEEGIRSTKDADIKHNVFGKDVEGITKLLEGFYGKVDELTEELRRKSKMEKDMLDDIALLKDKLRVYEQNYARGRNSRLQ